DALLVRAAAAVRVLPRKPGAEIGLVGRLVLRKADIPVDPEGRLGGVRPERHTPRPKALIQGHAERLERFLQQPLVLPLARLEPRSVVVGGQVGEELDPLATEPREWSRA